MDNRDDVDEAADVIVVGAGAAGCAAALAAHERGADVVVVDKCDESTVGGNTRVSGGGWWVNTDPARAAGFLRNMNEPFPVADDVVEAWAERSAELTPWLRSLGVAVERSADYHTEPEYAELDGSDCYAGMDTVAGGLGNCLLFDALHRALADRGITVRLETPAVELIGDHAGISGVVVESHGTRRRIGARGGVVLATGGFAANPRMVRDYLRVSDQVLWGSPASTGDGHRMAQAVGADLWHMDNMMTITGLRGDDEFGHYLALWAGPHYLWVSDDGRRFMDESKSPKHGHTRRDGADHLFPLRPFHVVFDEAMRTAGPLSPSPEILSVGWNLLMKGSRWSADNSEEIERGWIVRADSLAELAKLIDVDIETLERTVAVYNDACTQGRDDVFGRAPGTLGAVERPPFYAARVVPLLGWTNGGPRRDGRSRVLDTNHEPIAGLYAAGELSSTYSSRKDGGFHIADAFVFGRIAGEDAAARARG